MDRGRGRDDTANRMRTPETQELLDHLDHHVLPRWAEFRAGGTDHRELLIPVIDALHRARREFDSKLFFIVVFGPLKSGKSTLVNSLARDYVSPTKFAQESTRRSSIVIQSEERGIDLYYRIRPSGERLGRGADREAFEAVMQYLRGLLGEEALGEVVRRESIEFTPQNVDRVLSSDLEEEPLITVIRTHGGRLISEEIALLDVPGLDGHYTNYQQSPSSYWVIHKSDFLIFTQSSFSPLNHQTCAFLKDLYVESKKPPVWLVQNKMEARYWQEEALREHEAREQLQTARREITTLLGVPEEHLPASSINLGKASDGLFQDRKDLLDESRFESFEIRLRDELDHTRVRVLEENSLNELLIQLVRAEQRLNEIYADIHAALDQERVHLEALKRLAEQAGRIQYRNLEAENAFAELQERFLRDREDQMRARAFTGCESLREGLAREHPERRSGHRMIRGREINARISKLASDLAVEVGDTHFNLRGDFGQEISRYTDRMAEQSEALAVEEINTELRKQHLPVVPFIPRWKVHDMPEFRRSPLAFPHYREKTYFLWIFPWVRKYPVGAVETQLRKDMPVLFGKELSSRIRSWFAELKQVYFEDYANARRQAIRRHLEAMLQKEDARRRRNHDKSAAALDFIRAMLKDMVQLKKQAREAKAAFEKR